MATIESPLEPPIESSVATPAPGWARRFPRDERIFMWFVVASVVLMSAFTIGWLFLGNQNVPSASYRVTPAAFTQQVQDMIAKYGAEGGRVNLPPGEAGYMIAQRYSFYPELVLKAGQEYTIWVSATDSLHGLSIVGGNQNVNLQIAPNHAYGVTFTPDKPGEYLIVCNEYCGLAHHAMKGRLIVER
jgi:cytochrome c oxidase subunit II